MMGHSLAEDGDLTYRREDLMRVWREFSVGPTGLFLKKGRDILDGGTDAAAAVRLDDDRSPIPIRPGSSTASRSSIRCSPAPFVKLFGTNGFLVFHALLLALRRLVRLPVPPCAHAGRDLAALMAGAFVMATVVPVYFVWITPELFNFALGLLAYFCWLYKEVARAGARAARHALAVRHQAVISRLPCCWASRRFPS